MLADKIKQSIARAQHAQDLLNDPLFTDAWVSVETEVKNLWVATKSDDRAGREALYRELHGLRAIRARLETALKAGTLAEAELEHQKHGD